MLAFRLLHLECLETGIPEAAAGRRFRRIGKKESTNSPTTILKSHRDYSNSLAGRHIRFDQPCKEAAVALEKIAGVPLTFAGDESSITSTRSPVSITQEEQSIAARNIPGVGEPVSYTHL